MGSALVVGVVVVVVLATSKLSSSSTTALGLYPWCFDREYVGNHHWRGAQSSRTECVAKALKNSERDTERAQASHDAYEEWLGGLPEHQRYNALTIRDGIYQSWVKQSQ